MLTNTLKQNTCTTKSIAMREYIAYKLQHLDDRQNNSNCFLFTLKAVLIISNTRDNRHTRCFFLYF